MILYCRQCLFEGMALADSGPHGTIHEGTALCLYHFAKTVEPALADRILAPELVEIQSLRC